MVDQVVVGSWAGGWGGWVGARERHSSWVGLEPRSGARVLMAGMAAERKNAVGTSSVLARKVTHLWPYSIQKMNLNSSRVMLEWISLCAEMRIR